MTSNQEFIIFGMLYEKHYETLLLWNFYQQTTVRLPTAILR